jgi:hypothetical protein
MKNCSKKKPYLFVPIVAMIAACAAKPQQFTGQLDHSDPKYKSKDCSDIRLKALEYDDKVGSRVAIGLATGLLLGPFGIPIAAAADANQNAEREAWNREIHLRCSSKPLPQKDDKRDLTNSNS